MPHSELMRKFTRIVQMHRAVWQDIAEYRAV
jgi:hypothetical protein